MRLEKNEAALKDVAHLIEYAFNKTDSIEHDPLFLSRYEHATCYGQKTAGELTSLVMANHFTAQFYHSQLPLAGIGYVASFPEYRGSGEVAHTMVEVLNDLAKQNVALSLLAPFAEDFYRQFGYEQVSWQKKYQLNQQAFAQLKSEKAGSIKRGTWQTAALRETVLALYHEQLTAGCEAATIARENWWWQRSDQYYPHRFIAVAYDELHTACGYLIYRLKGDTFIVDELSYRTIFGLRKLLTFMKSHVSSFQKFSYAAPVTEQLEDCFLETADLQIELVPYMMGRIIDFQTVIENVPLKTGDYYFEVTQDVQCPQNVGIWHVAVADKNRVQKVENHSADLAGAITSWTQLLLGGRTLDALLFTERLTSPRPEKIKYLFPIGRHSFYDYF
ncbi:GNAT family N-acetyltransferase [Enterococcus sp. CSURQ0835]|uniref:GNAT family N-acetyltransferase n=1 Tax=Enterococcus sp. CSURQ0835 TaxID=2681394 RepID=UPI00135C118F|nr:GNAT family N-acetyltransferase [Enterococcus sp. CSURQ0835]